MQIMLTERENEPSVFKFSRRPRSRKCVNLSLKTRVKDKKDSKIQMKKERNDLPMKKCKLLILSPNRAQQNKLQAFNIQ